MKAALRLLRVKVQNVGILGDRAVELGPFVPGVNVISGPNESGKTTIVRALRAALFQRHGSKHESIRSLQPHGNRKAAPRVEVEFELDGTAYLLEKQFMVGVSSRLHTADGSLSLKDDDADLKVFSLLGAREPAKKGTNPDDMGVWSLLWVNQDEFATAEPAKHLGDHVRGTLAESIGGIVGDVMGGEHGIHLRRAIEQAYTQVWTPKQTDRATGELARAREACDRLAAEVSELEEKVRKTVTLGADLQALELDMERLREEERACAEVEQCALAAAEADRLEQSYQEAAARLEGAERLHDAARRANAVKRCATNSPAPTRPCARTGRCSRRWTRRRCEPRSKTARRNRRPSRRETTATASSGACSN
ncbi:MAG: AAA family ATPase [Polyangiales bacterium]